MNEFSEDYLDGQKQLALKVSKIDNEDTWKAPSAQHALAWLRVNLYMPSWYATQSEDGRFSGLAKPIFRGQGDANWDLAPGLLRVSEGELEYEKKATLIFSKISEVFFKMVRHAVEDISPPLTVECGNVVAQHFGMKTSLLDWTTNPGVAVDMATFPDPKRKGKRPGQMAAVHWLSLHDLGSMNIVISLPPHFITRVYMQRGFFIKVEDNNQLALLSSKTKKIIFPLEDHLKCEGIDFGTQQKVSINLMPKEDWFENLHTWSREQAPTYIEKVGDEVPLYMNFISKFPHFNLGDPMLPVSAMLVSGEIVLQVQDYIDQLARRDTKEGSIHDNVAMKLIRKHNNEYFDWFKI